MSDAELVPSWVPEIAPGVRADVYPVEPPRPSRAPYCESPPELILDRYAVTTGYSERRQPYEFASCLPATVTSASAPPLSSALPGSVPHSFHHTSGSGLTTSDLLKLRNGIARLRRSRPTKLQRVEQHTFAAPKPSSQPPPVTSTDPSTASFTSKNAFPLQKPSGSNSLEEWFNKLSSGASFNTSELSRSVPLGPAIVRAAGKVIEMMATRSVPTQRAAWYIRIAVLNECVKQIRPDRPPPSPRTFWTKQLCGLLKTEMDAIRARKTAILGSMDRVTFWDYVLDLARWQADEDLLDMQQWLSKIGTVLRVELTASQTFNSPGTRIAMSAARRFLPEFLSSRSNARLLLESLLPGADAIVKARRNAPMNVNKTDSSSVGSVHGKRETKSASRKGVVKRSHFTANECHREVRMLLSAMVRFLDGNIIGNVESETKMSDLERFVKRGIGIIVRCSSPENGDPKKAGLRNSTTGINVIVHKKATSLNISYHRIIRELEMLPGHGDVKRVTRVLRAAAARKGGLRFAVKQVCEWTVGGPVSDRAEALCVGSAVLKHLAHCSPDGNSGYGKEKAFRHIIEDIHRIRGQTSEMTWVPPLQRDIWDFLKNISRDKKASSLDRDDYLVRFIAHLCRTRQLSLRGLVRDISRLSSHSHPGAGYLIKCLALLPDQTDEQPSDSDSVLTVNVDCRRPLLRKYGLISNTRQRHGRPVDEKVVQSVLSGNISAMEREADRLIKTCDTNRILSTAEAVRLSSMAKILEKADIASPIFSVPSFFLIVNEPGMAVQWLMAGLSDVVNSHGVWESEPSRKKKNEALSLLARLVEDMARYIAASGFLEDVFYILKKAWLSSWVSSAAHTRILLSTAAVSKMFVGNADTPVPFWSDTVAKHLRQRAESTPAVSKLIPLAMAAMRGQLDGKPRDDVKFDDILNSAKKDSVTPEQDLSKAFVCRQLHATPIERVKMAFADTDNDFPLEAYFSRGFTANDIFGAVLIPVLSGTLVETPDNAIDSAFSRLVVSSLQLIDGRQNDVRLQGVRPPILLEFIAIILTGVLYGRTEAAVSLEVLVGMSWAWKILAPGAGIGLAKQLRCRVDHYCNKIGRIDKTVLSALLFNMVTRFSGDSSRDEVGVSSALGSEPFGMIDMQLSLLATYRRECGEDEEFGSRICDAVVSSICAESARSLASVVLQCCDHEESRHIVAGIVGYGAAQAMGESLQFLVKGMTVDASKNSSTHQERAAQWYQADSARRSILECIVENLSQEVGIQVETVLFDQLSSAMALLTNARERECMPSNLLEDGMRISDALESRFHCILRSQRTPQNAEVWTQRSLQVAELLRCAVPVMRKSALTSICNVLKLCISNLADCFRVSDSTNAPSSLRSQILDAIDDDDFKAKIREVLRPVMSWCEEPERKMLGSLVQVEVGTNARLSNIIRAYDTYGRQIDSWVLLEGYGRGPNEDAALPPTAFGRQGEGASTDNVMPVVQLKRTYSTFSSLAV
eukprot:GFKZ01007599.1.p1 GENE.GFKZ01007599.1~~GFKZ01007599.1.p1  ORF type:complete len:1485 (-),score=183.36 GFKZ01007599.1:2837-7291(-)